MKKPRVVSGSPSVELSRKEFVLRFQRRHEDPAFKGVAGQLDAVAEVAWKNYIEYHKSPNTRRAGSAFAKPGNATRTAAIVSLGPRPKTPASTPESASRVDVTNLRNGN